MKPKAEGWAEIRPDGSTTGQMNSDKGDEANFIARKWT